MLLGIIGWVVIGLVVGLIVSKTLDLHGDDPRFGIGAAVIGAVLLATVYTIVSGAGVSAWNVWSMLWAAIGAGAAVTGWHIVRSRFVSRAPYTRRSSY